MKIRFQPVEVVYKGTSRLFANIGIFDSFLQSLGDTMRECGVEEEDINEMLDEFVLLDEEVEVYLSPIDAIHAFLTADEEDDDEKST